jgi:hypothetical protein
MKRRAPMDVVCAHCGKTFTRIHGQFPRYCSISCGAYAKTDLPSRLAAMSKQMPYGCIEWQRSVTSGYGQISIDGRPMRAHRIAYELAYGPIPQGKFVCHRCDNPKCINSEHLFLGSNRDNMHDAKTKNRIRNGEKHPGAKLTDAQVRHIRNRRAAGVKYIDIAREYPDTPYLTIYTIARGITRTQA